MILQIADLDTAWANIIASGLASMDIGRRDEVAFGREIDGIPIPVYVMDLEEAQGGSLPSAPSIWRLFFQADGEEMSADLDVEANGKISFNSVYSGGELDLYVPALAAAEDHAARTDDVFALRILEIPALFEVAIWLHGQKIDWMIAVLRFGVSSDVGLVRSVDYIAEVSGAASRSRTFDRSELNKGISGNDFSN